MESTLLIATRIVAFKIASCASAGKICGLDQRAPWVQSEIAGQLKCTVGFVIADLVQSCPSLAEHIAAEHIVSMKNADVRTRVAVRNVDLVFAEKEMGPGAVRAAVENKTIMAAHGKARKNRHGDLIAYCNHVHNHRDACIAAAIVVVNRSPAYENPDAFAKGLERPRFRMEKVVGDTLKIFYRDPTSHVRNRTQ